MVACAIVLFGFLTFAGDEAARGSDQQVARIGQALGDPAPTQRTERQREKEHGAPRELLDDANDILLAPFSGVVDSKDAWVRRVVPTALALLAYGLGLTLLANFLPRPSGASGDWRAA